MFIITITITIIIIIIIVIAKLSFGNARAQNWPTYLPRLLKLVSKTKKHKIWPQRKYQI